MSANKKLSTGSDLQIKFCSILWSRNADKLSMSDWRFCAALSVPCWWQHDTMNSLNHNLPEILLTGALLWPRQCNMLTKFAQSSWCVILASHDCPETTLLYPVKHPRLLRRLQSLTVLKSSKCLKFLLPRKTLSCLCQGQALKKKQFSILNPQLQQHSQIKY